MSSKKFLLCMLVLMLAVFALSGCGGSPGTPSTSSDSGTNTGEDTQSGEIITVTDSDTHAISLTGSSSTGTYSNITIYKSGAASSSSENADFYGTNAAVLSSNGATLTLTDSYVSTDARYANAVFAYGGTVNVSNTTIKTYSSNSGGIMTTGGGTMNATDLTITTSGNSAAAIRSDKGGGTVTVDGGTYTTSGTGSPVIYCTADITVSGADLESQASEGVVIEGGNSVTLDQCNLTANHTKLNGQDTSYHGVMIYQSGSGDASDGTGTFTMKNCSFTNQNGAVFFTTHTTAIINLEDSTITNNDSDNIFLNSSEAAWGDGAAVTLNATNQAITGDITIDSTSSLNMNLTSSSTFNGAINKSLTTSGGTVAVNIASGCTWTLTGNSYVSSLTNNGTINKGSYTLYVNGIAQ
ncbi:MAG: hypothetical protein IJT21_01360 [Synergistaceae bacterium]|nr:hypothetical protein [Synergistaceae bacterium]